MILYRLYNETELQKLNFKRTHWQHVPGGNAKLEELFASKGACHFGGDEGMTYFGIPGNIEEDDYPVGGGEYRFPDGSGACVFEGNRVRYIVGHWDCITDGVVLGDFPPPENLLMEVKPFSEGRPKPGSAGAVVKVDEDKGSAIVHFDCGIKMCFRKNTLMLEHIPSEK